MPRISTEVKDYLEQDAPVRGQNYACLSFISPDDAVATLEAFATSKFLESFCVDACEALTRAEELAAGTDAHQTLKNIRDRYSYVFDAGKLMEERDMFRKDNEARVLADYGKLNDNITCVRGVKVRGVFDTLEEATKRAGKLKITDPHFHVYVGEVGCWLPFSPSPEDLQDARYTETSLNTLMEKYKQNVEDREEFYRTRRDALVAAAQEDGGGALSPAEVQRGLQEQLEVGDTWTGSRGEYSEAPDAGSAAGAEAAEADALTKQVEAALAEAGL